MTPALLLCGLSNHGDTWLPIRADLQVFLGSSWTASMLAAIGLYAWFSLRGIKHASLGLPTGLLLMSGTAELPRGAEAYGMANWMIAATASVVALGMVLRHRKTDWGWLAFAASVVVTLVLVGDDSGQQQACRIAAAAVALTAMLAIGAAFETELATALRHLACVVAIAALVIGTVRFLVRDDVWPLVAVPIVATVTLAYAFLVRRRGWLFVSAFHVIAFVVLLGWSTRNARTWKVLNWPIASGLACLGVGLAITSSKAGFYRQIRLPKPTDNASRFRPGL